MKIATIRTERGSVAARIDDETAAEIPGYRDVGELLREPDWVELAASAGGPAHALEHVELELLISHPSKVLCVGLNYRNHILEMGQALPEHPTVFAKFAETLAAPFDSITAVAEDHAIDWEGELALVIGERAYRVAESQASRYIAGYTVANDISMRSWQERTPQWLQGKMWARSTPIGPYLVTSDCFDPAHATLRTLVNGETVQEEATADLLFSPARLVAYLSTILPLNPGDIILTGTPGGVGHARKPPQYLAAGDVVEVEISGLGRLRNLVVAPVKDDEPAES